MLAVQRVFDLFKVNGRQTLTGPFRQFLSILENGFLTAQESRLEAAPYCHPPSR